MSEDRFQELKDFIETKFSQSHGSLHSDMTRRLLSLEGLAASNQHDLRQLQNDVQPVVDFFSHITWLKTAVMWFLTFAAAVGAAFAVIKGFYR